MMKAASKFKIGDGLQTTWDAKRKYITRNGLVIRKPRGSSPGRL
jgi:hypothetical protein